MSFIISKRFKQPSSLGQNLSLSGLEDDYHNLGCDDSQISSRALSLMSWGTPCPPATAAFDFSIDHTNLECLVTDNTCNNLTFFSHIIYTANTINTNTNSHKNNILHLKSSIKCNLQV